MAERIVEIKNLIFFAVHVSQKSFRKVSQEDGVVVVVVVVVVDQERRQQRQDPPPGIGGRIGDFILLIIINVGVDVDVVVVNNNLIDDNNQVSENDQVYERVLGSESQSRIPDAPASWSWFD